MHPHFKALHTIFGALPRQGPGSPAATLRALAAVPPLPPDPLVLDLGCGSGASTLVLARQLDVPVLAVDIMTPLLKRLETQAQAEGLSHLITTRQGDMADPGVEPGSVDLIWCEGAAYSMGFANAIKSWHKLLRPGGCLGLSELCWLAPNAPHEVRSYLKAIYPPMTDVNGNLDLAREAGYQVLEYFTLEHQVWEDFYAPLPARLEELAPQAESDPVLAEVIQETRRELEIFRLAGETYGYLFMVLRKEG